MDKSVIWTNEVYEDLGTIAEFIAKNSFHYASNFVEEVLQTGKTLNIFPERGRIVPEIDDSDIRKIFVRGYRLIYQVKSDRVIILALIHGGRDLKIFWSKERRSKQ